MNDATTPLRRAAGRTGADRTARTTTIVLRGLLAVAVVALAAYAVVLYGDVSALQASSPPGIRPRCRTSRVPTWPMSSSASTATPPGPRPLNLLVIAGQAGRTARWSGAGHPLVAQFWRGLPSA